MMKPVAIESRKIKGDRAMIYSIHDFYKEYKIECREQYGKDYKQKMLSRDLFLEVLEMYFTELASEIVKSRKPYKMPNRMGWIKIKKHKCSRSKVAQRRIKFARTSEKSKKKLEYFWNYLYKEHFFLWSWKKRYARGVLRFVTWYSFTPARAAKKTLSNHVFECGTDPKKKTYDVEKGITTTAKNKFELPAP